MVEKKATLILLLKDLISKNLSKVGNSLSRLGGIIKKNQNAIAALGAGILFVGKKLIDAADSMEQWTISFETMLGSADKARKLMNDIKRFAVETPFELPDVIKGAKGLLAFGIELEDVIPNLKNLGDVAAGLSVPIDRLILNFGQVKSQAKLTGRELRDFAIAGVPLIAELAKNLNVAEGEIADLVSRGKIGFKDVELAFNTMAGAGGKFENLMSKQMKTFSGIVSNVKDQVFQLSATLGETLLPTAKEVGLSIIDRIQDFRDMRSELEDVIKVIIQFGETAFAVFEAFGELVGTQLFLIFELFESLRLLLTGEFTEAWENWQTATNEAITSVKDTFKNMVKDILDANKKRVKEIKKIAKKEKKEKLEEDIEERKRNISFWKFLLDGQTKAVTDEEKLQKNRAKVAVDTLNFIASASDSSNKAIAAVGKAAAISVATIDTFVAANKALAAFPGPLGIAMAALVTVAGLANVAKISGVQLQEGGVVLPTPGGTQATIGEGRKAEAVIPLDDEEAQDKLSEALGGGETTIIIQAGTIIADDTSVREFASRIDEELFDLRSNREAVSFGRD